VPVIRAKAVLEIDALRERRWTERDAREVLLAQRRSGQSIVAFARETGLSAERLYWWRRRLGAAEQQERPTEPELTDIEFAPVMLTNSSRATLVVRAGDVELEFAAPETADPKWIAALVAELRRP
jgi:hypothetical protein